jgi:maleylacetate reductase
MTGAVEVAEMSMQFTWSSLGSRVVFARGSLHEVAAEVERLNGSRVLLIGSGAPTAGALLRLRESLGKRVAAEIADSAQHVPEGIAEAAVATARGAEADVVVSLGGGSATGLGKSVALATGLPLVAVPTTYAGSEMTSIWGRTAAGVKQTGMDARVKPKAVVYDAELCLGMPSRLAAASGMNALAHCVEALWSAGHNPITSVLAEEGIRRLVAGLPGVVADPDDIEAHETNLVGACLAGLALAEAGTGIHHRTCHVLGGGWNLPHAETHAVVLPHATALVAPRAPDAMKKLSVLLESDDPAAALFELVGRLQLPRSLESLGMPRQGLDEAVRRVSEAVRQDPLVPDAAAVRRMLEHADSGRQPEMMARVVESP